MNTENLSTLKINKLTNSQYKRELEAGRIDEFALYLTPEDANLVNGSAEGSLRGLYTAEENESYTIGEYSFAEGELTYADGYSSHAEGIMTHSSGVASHTEGYDTVASGDYSHAEGCGTNASGDYAHAEGLQTKASSDYQHVEGKYNIEDVNSDYLHIVGNGTSSNRSNAYTLDKDGNAWFSGDVYISSTSGTNRDNGSVKLQKEIPVTTSDNGKFLRVVDGVWAAATVPNAEEASF